MSFSRLMNEGKLTNKAFGYAFMVIFCGQSMGLLQEEIQYVLAGNPFKILNPLNQERIRTGGLSKRV